MGFSTPQLTLYEEDLRGKAVAAAAANDDTATRGAVFTKPAVVRFILDLAGYTSDADLLSTRLLEPSCGEGDFLLPATGRLVAAAAHLSRRDAEAALRDAVCAVDVHAGSLRIAGDRLRDQLTEAGFTRPAADRLIAAWLHCDDFLLHDELGDFTHVIGNPPYIRQERVPDELMAAYRARFRTIYDRADLYVPFFEKGLALLRPGGRLGYICADRWMKNRYGAKLRGFIAAGYHLHHYADMTGTDAFTEEVDAYPAITVIERSGTEGERAPDAGEAPPTRAVYRPAVSDTHLTALARKLTATRPGTGVEVLHRVAVGELPWLLQHPRQLRLLRRLEARFPTLEEAGARVAIGVATGADKVYIGPYDDLPVEPARKLRLSTTRDINSGQLKWRGLGVVNPFEEDGTLADPGRYPRFAAWLDNNEPALRGRNVAKRNAARWYRTIDRITPSIANQPKLLIPDIKGVANVVFENDQLYPHHNLYYVTSDSWPLEPLGVVLRSAVTRMFMRSYSTPMRGGYLRFQAQYLRRLRLPHWNDVTPARRKKLETAIAGDQAKQDRAAADLYGLTAEEREETQAVQNASK